MTVLPQALSKAEVSATAILSGIPGYNYSVQRATNVLFTLGVSNFPTVTAPANGQITNIDDFADLFGTPNTAASATSRASPMRPIYPRSQKRCRATKS